MWQRYCASEIETVTPILQALGFTLDAQQPHIQGERYLMQAVTTAAGRKLILLGNRNSDGMRVVIKVSRDPGGIEEIRHERVCRGVLHKINFAYNTFFSPQELLFKKRQDFLISIQEFIEQDRTFLERPTPEQFSFALTAFKAQEGARATTNKHRRTIAKTFALRDQAVYLQKFAEFQDAIGRTLPENTNLQKTLAQAGEALHSGATTIEQYGDFLTHTDFVPHNFRIRNDRLFLLDHSSLTFGNKYEGWARFVNFMTLYNPELEQALLQYVRDNRSEGEIESLRLMRMYRLGEILYYYSDKLQYSEGNLLKLNKARIQFWADILRAVINDSKPPASLIETYKAKRDALRSDDEKTRQKGLH